MAIKINKYSSKKNKFIISNRDIFESSLEKVNLENGGSSVVIPHVCNNIDMFGAGFASAIANKFPIAKMNYHMLGKKFLKENLGYCQIIKAYENPKNKNAIYVANMIAQNGIISENNPRPLNYFSLAKSMSLISNFITNKIKENNDNLEKIDIHCPKFGSGLAGGNWYFISDLIDDIWQKFDVTVYTLSRDRQ